jgi:hypothetical protein
MKRASIYPLISRVKFPSGPAGFAVEVPGMSIVGVFERPFALDERLGFRT